MGYIDHIRACNNFDAAGFRPLAIGGQRIGFVRHRIADRLRDWPEVFAVFGDRVAISDSLGDFDARSRAVETVLRALAADGTIEDWREERYPVTPNWHTPPLMQVERAACPLLGIRAFGVHLNGYVRDGGALHMWVARRARDKATFPGMLDNIVAGGQPIGIGLLDNVVKECHEEAGIPAALARQSLPVGLISYRHEQPEGCKPDQMFCYDLEFSPDFQPTAVDGEVESFHLMPVDEVAAIVRDGFEFKFNCNLVIIDFLIRHGLLNPDNEPDYTVLCEGLRAGG